MKNPRQKYDWEYKRQIVAEFLSGSASAIDIAEREQIRPAQIYRWKSQLESRKKIERIEGIALDESVSIEQARKLVELEEELAAYKEKVAEQAMVIDLLKKIHPSSVSEKKSSGYIETKRSLAVKRKPRK